MKRICITAELRNRDWAEKTIPEIAAELHTDEQAVKDSMRYIRRKYGISIPYRHRQRGRKCVSHEQA